MKVVIAGSRDGVNYHHVCRAIQAAGYDITKVVSGGARGVDKMGEEYAKNHDIPIALFRANWTEEGKSAGFNRNLKMVEYADAGIFVWDGQSRGTKHCYDAMKAAGKPAFLAYVPQFETIQGMKADYVVIDEAATIDQGWTFLADN